MPKIVRNEPYRIAVWGPGDVGSICVREAIRRSDLDVVGAYVYSESKDGVDIGTLVGKDPIGVYATRDKSSWALAFLIIASASAYTQDLEAVNADKTESSLSSKSRGRLVIEEVVVTAQKREESINKVPISISAFSGDSLETLGAVDTRDLGNLVAGFTYADSGYNTPIYTLRGVGFNDTTYTATSTVGIYIDEINIPYSVMSKGANIDLERVEILKGPQGTLYGRNTTGGAINYIANKPIEEFEAGISATYSRFQATDVEAYVSGGLAENLNGRLALNDIRSQEGWQYSNTRPDDTLGVMDKQSGRGAFEWTPSDSLFVRFTLEGWQDRSDATAGQAVALTPLNPTLGEAALAPQVSSYPLVPQEDADPQVADWVPGRDWKLNDSFYMAAVKTEWNIGESYRLVGSLSTLKVKSDKSAIPQSGLDVNNAEQEITAQIKTSALEVRLESTSGEDFNWMLGVNSSQDRGKEFHDIFADTVSSAFPVLGEAALTTRVTSSGQSDVHQLGFFINTNWHLTDTLKLIAGARYTDQEQEYQGCSTDHPEGDGIGLGPLVTIISAQRALQTGNPQDATVVSRGECITLTETGSNEMFKGDLPESNLAWRLSLDWQMNDDALLYGSLSRGFKSGGFPVLNSTDQSQFTPTTQERLDAYEVGAKVTIFNNIVQVNTAVFYYDYKDKQLLTKFEDPVFGPLPVLRNAPDSRVIGAELDITTTPLEGLYLAASSAYIDSKVKKFESLTVDGDEFDFSGKPFNYSPKLQYTLVADYTLYLDSGFDIGIGADYSYSSDTNATLEEDPRFDMDSYGITSFRLHGGRSDGSWKASLFVRNAFNELAAISVVSVGDTAVRYVQKPRIYGATFSYDF